MEFSMRIIIIMLSIFYSAFAMACPIDNRTIEELTQGATHIYKGAVVQIHWFDYENFIKNDVLVDGEEHLLLRDKYTFKTIPQKFYKGTNDIPISITGGGCSSLSVEGRKEYVFFLFNDNEISTAIALEFMTDKDYSVLNAANK
jgi:hypothetical protein